MSKIMLKPVFILPVFLLPNGCTRLRVFEQRYLKLIKLASNTDGFIIAINTELDAIAADVKIINFEQGSDGVLIVDVCCTQLVKLQKTDIDADNLMMAETKNIDHWADNVDKHDPANTSDLSKEFRYLSKSLIKVFEQNDTLSQIFHENFFEHKYWVVARWIELLPIPIEKKQIFYSYDSFHKAVRFIYEVLAEQK